MNRIVLQQLQLPVVNGTYEEVLKEMEQGLTSFCGRFAVFFEGNLLSRAISEKDVCNCVRSADWIFPDGIVICRLLSVYSKEKISRISGPTFILKACEYGQKLGWRHFFYGGTPETLEKLSANLKEKYPELCIAGMYAPPFRPLNEQEEFEVKERIESSKADFLWVGLGGPKQEFWILKHRDKISVPIMLGVGAAFDFHSGTRPWAPCWIRKIGMEWLWRMFSGGRKTFQRNIRCILCTLWYLFHEKIRVMLTLSPGKRN